MKKVLLIILAYILTLCLLGQINFIYIKKNKKSVIIIEDFSNIL